MTKCLYTNQIDDYLLNKLEGGAREQFEEHYFNCPSCFRQMEERDSLISTIKSRGAWLFKDEAAAEQRDWVPAWKRALSSFTPRQWATGGVSAAALLLVVFGGLPQFRGESPQFVLSETEVVRGESLTLMSPIIDVKSVPSFFEWKSLGQEVEYKISLYNGGVPSARPRPDQRRPQRAAFLFEGQAAHQPAAQPRDFGRVNNDLLLSRLLDGHRLEGFHEARTAEGAADGAEPAQHFGPLPGAGLDHL